MASSTLSLTSPSYCAPITDEEFNDFHAIDRVLYSRLVLGLARDPAESMQVMALWLWLERGGRNSLLVKKLLSLPGSLVNTLADEAAMCLRCVESDRFVFDPEGNDIPLLQSMLGSDVSLRYFHENRIGVLRGVTKIVNEVCVRAFGDITRLTFGNNPIFVVSSNEVGVVVPTILVAGGGAGVAEPTSFESDGERGTYRSPVVSVPFYPGYGVVSHVGYGGGNVAPVVLNHGGGASDKIGNPTHIVPGVSVHGNDPYDLTKQRQILNNELSELLGRISLSVSEEEKEVPPDDRTIFLTFSKGYPISETEVLDFFTRKFGDFIEAIYMQEVPAEEQVLYARLVARSASAIHVVLEGQSKAKFSINGKHVWARKYVKKNPKSPSQQPTSPVAAAPKP